MTTIAYLAPELPARSATFVYEEIHALERRGVQVVPFSVNPPADVAAGQAALAARTTVLYAGGPMRVALRALADLRHAGDGVAAARALLAADRARVGAVSRTAGKLAFQWLAAASLARHMLDAGCERLHAHFASVPAQIAMYASAMSGIPFTLTAHANDIFERPLLLREKAERALRFNSISRFNLGYLNERGLARDKLALVRCGATFEPAPPAAAGRVAPGVERRVRIGSLGRLVEKKGMDDLVRAVALLVREGIAVELQIAGGGPLEAELRQLVAAEGVEAHVTFLGAVDHAQVLPWLRSLDIYAMACKASRSGDMDGIPVAMMEAMSQRIPVVTTRLSGIPELVIDDQTGLLAEPGDPQGFARQLRRLVEDPALAARLAASGGDWVRHEFNVDRNIDRLLTGFGYDPARFPVRAAAA